MIGKITWYNDKQGFGFITGLDGGNKLFFHASQRDLFSLDQTVTYETKENADNGRLFAVNVKPEE